jgi:tetratricopeptide (TPR) repeat protein
VTIGKRIVLIHRSPLEIKNIAFVSAVVLLGLFLVPSPATASQVMTYRTCLAMVDENPVTGYAGALKWHNEEGGTSASHCMSLALIGQGAYAQAAELLEEVALSLSVKAGAFQRVPQLQSQAGNAWLLANDGVRAYAMFDDALQQRGLDNVFRSELLIDRSRASALIGDYSQSLADVNSALGLVGVRVDLLVYRASAHRMLGNVDEAQIDIEHALKLRPNDADGLFERGNLKFALGDVEEAQADWHQVVTLNPHSSAGSAAKRNLEELDAAVKRASATPPTPAGQPPAPAEPAE